MTQFHVPGFPRVGRERQLKWALESYWRGDSSVSELESVARKVRHANWQAQIDAGVDWLTIGDFCYYDHMLNTSQLLGHLPERVKTTESPQDQLFLAARGRAPSGQPVPASEMTKWFDTNYHYLIPECQQTDCFNIHADSLINEVREARQLTERLKVALPGPITYLWLSQSVDDSERLDLLETLTTAYCEILTLLKEEGVEWVQLDEPALVLDLPAEWLNAFEPVYHRLQTCGTKILLATYFGSVSDQLTRIFHLPVQGVHLDIAEAPEQLGRALDLLGPYKVLSVGAINGRNIWRTDLEALYRELAPVADQLGDRLWVSTSCSLLHVPYSASRESGLTDGCDQWLAFAEEKLEEGALLRAALNDGSTRSTAAWLDQAQRVVSRRTSLRVHRHGVKERAANICSQQWHRTPDYPQRLAAQQAHLKLPLFPTTTIGSFPQTSEIRNVRKEWRAGRLDTTDYESALESEIAHCISLQEKLGLDVLVHGEAERTDMVEYFGELLDGIAVTAAGWVQSYGSRCVKPPVIYGDIERPEPLTVRWSAYAQSLSEKPVKGMLTGPVTILKWAFVRDDQPWSDTACQLSAVLHDEVQDLVEAGISVIQIDEPALREALPLKADQQKDYLTWAVNSFRYCYAGVDAHIQIHTHMCYADFDGIIDAIAAMDADVITLETARSASALLDTLRKRPYANGIGPGVYDIHSPNVPAPDAMSGILEQSAELVPLTNLWVNPDCGLKTRRWDEVIPALEAMVQVAESLRSERLVAAELSGMTNTVEA